MVQILASTLSSFKLSRKTREEYINEGFENDDINNKPVVYIQIDKKNLYVGVSTGIHKRFKSHIRDEGKTFTEILIITSQFFNESSIKHIETLLIDYLKCDNKFNVLNSTDGQAVVSYNGIENVYDMFPSIWEKLIEEQVAFMPKKDIENEFLFKYSPFKILSQNQIKIINDILNKMLTQTESKSVVTGDPGTGKTVVLSNLLYGLVYNRDSGEWRENIDRNDIALIIPQNHSLSLYKKLIKQVGLHGINVLTPSQFIKAAKKRKTKFRYVFVEEAHRLKQYFGKQARELKHLLTNEGFTNELLLIEQFSNHLTIVYDKYQTIRPADIDTKFFDHHLETYDRIKLRTQFRLKSGDQYLGWLRTILQITNDEVVYEKGLLEGYNFEILDSISDVYNAVYKLNEKHELCRTLSGFAWEWQSAKGKSDFDIQDEQTGQGFKWNSKRLNWVNSENSKNEVGCIHTIQGADLNYVGVVFGKEIKYDKKNQRIIVDVKEYKDKNGIPKKGTDLNNEELLAYIKRIYYVLLSRGINGCYIYIEDKALRDHFKQAKGRTIV